MQARIVFAIVMLILGALGCTAEVTTDLPTGALSVALSQSDPSGDVFRLRGAVLELTGAAELTLMPSDDEESFATELPVGDYALELSPGWTLERERGGQTLPVQATLLSDNPQPVSIALDQLAEVSLLFGVSEDGSVGLGTGMLQVSLEVEPSAHATDCAQQLVISELDYNQDGSDDAEFVELYNPSSCALPTAGLALSLRNGGTSPAATYAQIALASAGAEIPAHGYLVIGAPSVLASLPAGALAVALGSVTLQNGDPDGVVLEQDGAILDAVSYGGDMPGVTETLSAPVDRGAGSLARCPNGRDTDNNSADFVVSTELTPGASNACP